MRMAGRKETNERLRELLRKTVELVGQDGVYSSG